jgi:orotidine-5'-phosphate decarboxylase
MGRVQIFEQIQLKRSFLCIGLDSDIRKIPAFLQKEADPVFSFNKAIIDATASFAIAFKPNTAFYEINGAKGWTSLEKTIAYIKTNYPEILVIADAKRGDIGNTSAAYAHAFFEHLKADAITVTPYMGHDSVTPFLGFAGKWLVLLALTSNAGSSDFQQLKTEDGLVYEEVIRKATAWGTADQLMFVVGATQTGFLENIRKLAPDHFLLVPGIGAQGGDLEQVAWHGMNKQCGLIVNASRSIIYASADHDFAEAAANETSKMQQQMAKLLTQKHLL